MLAGAIRPYFDGRLHVVKTVDEAVAAVVALARPGDAVITLGAGSIGTAGKRVLAALGQTEGGRA